MDCKSSTIKPSPWTAWRSYLSFDGKAKSIISNEKSHQKVFLDDESSLLWAQIEKGVTYTSLRDRAVELGLGDDLDAFLDELYSLELLFNENDVDLNVKPDLVPVPQSMEDAENTEPEREFQNWVMAQGFMFHTHWELTYRCNERCVHCYNPGAAHTKDEKPQRNNKELSTQQVFKSLDSFAKGGVFGLTLTGGEIMLRKDFYEIVEYARKLGMAVNIYTNAIKLDESAIKRLAKLWVSTVSVSVYSHVPEVHDDITRVPGSYEKAVKALKLLNDMGIKTSLKSVQMDHTLQAYKGIAKLSEDLGAIPETELGLSPGVDGAIAPMLMSTNNPAELIVAASTPGFPIFVGDASNNFGEFVKDPKATVCAAGYSGLSVAADGNIYPCNSLPIKSGNLHQHDPLEIWNSALGNRKSITSDQKGNLLEFKHLDGVTDNLSKWQDVRLEHYQECGTHSRCNWCVKCPGMAFMETGNALAPSTTNCRLANAKMFAAYLLKSGETRESIAEALGVSQDFGTLAPRPRKEILEPEEGRSSGADPRNSIKIFRKDGSQLELASTKNSYTSSKGELWLKNGSKWNIEAMAEFDAIRTKFDVLEKTSIK